MNCGQGEPQVWRNKKTSSSRLEVTQKIRVNNNAHKVPDTASASAKKCYTCTPGSTPVNRHLLGHAGIYCGSVWRCIPGYPMKMFLSCSLCHPLATSDLDATTGTKRPHISRLTLNVFTRDGGSIHVGGECPLQDAWHASFTSSTGSLSAERPTKREVNVCPASSKFTDAPHYSPLQTIKSLHQTDRFST